MPRLREVMFGLQPQKHPLDVLSFRHLPLAWISFPILKVKKKESKINREHPTQPILDQVTALSHVQRSSIAKEVQMLVRNGLVHSDSEDGHSSGNWKTGLVELDPGEVISCTHAPLKA